jgi:hypothetical protein
MTLLLPAALESKQLLCSQECSPVQLKRIENTTTIETNLEKLLLDGNLTEMEERYMRTQLAFKNLDLRILDEGPFVLISFGSVAQVGLQNFYLINW